MPGSSALAPLTVSQSLVKIHPPLPYVIDRTNFANSRVASAHANHIIRAEYGDRFYTDLAYEVLEKWNSSYLLKGKGFYHQPGSLTLNQRGSDTAHKVRRILREKGADLTRDIDMDKVRILCNGVFKDMDLEGFDDAYWNPSGGWCDAASAIRELMGAAVKKGVNCIVGTVDHLTLRSDGVEGVVTRNGSRYSADKIVLATGAWTSSILTITEDELQIPENDRIERQISAAAVCAAYYELTPEEAQELQNMPVVIYGDKGECQPPPLNRLLKVTFGESLTYTVRSETGHIISIPLNDDQPIASEILADKAQQLAQRVLPQYTKDRPPHSWHLCWDAVSPTQDPLLTRHPHSRLQNLFLAVGGSFHSFKFLPTIGQYVFCTLHDISKGKEKDMCWAWKTEEQMRDGERVYENAAPKFDLRIFGHVEER